MPFGLITGPEEEPISLGEAKSHLVLESASEDDLVDGLITAARQWAEEYCWRGLVLQQWELVLDGFRGVDRLELGRRPPLIGPANGYFFGERTGRDDYIELPRGQLATLPDDDPAVESVKYIDTNGTEQTLSTDLYTVDTVNQPGRVRLAYGKQWPQTRRQWDAVRIRYSVGWDVEDVPQPIKQALLLLVSQMYEHRTPEVFGALSKVQFAVEALLAPYRILLP